MSADVYEQIRQDIVSGRLPAGARLTEAALADEYGVSRTPVREALRRLEQDGLAERGAGGMAVRTRSAEEVLEIYEVRILLEAAAARAAAERSTSLDRMMLQQAHQAMTEMTTEDPEAVAAANRRFHERLWAAGHNTTLIDLLRRLSDHLTRYPTTTLGRPGRWQEVLREHQAMLAAITAGEPETAFELARAHMSRARDLRLQMWAEEGSAE